MPLHIALTGNVASGKSAVARLFAEWGATVIDADAIVRELERPGTTVFDAIVGRFGRSVVAPSGQLNRAALRARVLADPAERRALEAIVHPAVAAERERRLLAARERGDAIVVSDIPLLFEVMRPEDFDAVVLVDAPAAVRRERLVRDRGLSVAEADALLAAQLPASQKRAGSDFVIENDGTPDRLRDRAREVWHALRARARRRA
ncbi:MAG: dephospho-CoA kinase [Gemmatimonadales bacterium]